MRIVRTSKKFKRWQKAIKSLEKTVRYLKPKPHIIIGNNYYLTISYDRCPEKLPDLPTRVLGFPVELDFRRERILGGLGMGFGYDSDDFQDPKIREMVATALESMFEMVGIKGRFKIGKYNKNNTYFKFDLKGRPRNKNCRKA